MDPLNKPGVSRRKALAIQVGFWQILICLASLRSRSQFFKNELEASNPHETAFPAIASIAGRENQFVKWTEHHQLVNKENPAVVDNQHHHGATHTDQDTQKNSWKNCPAKSSLVTVGTHSLFLSVSGPPRQQAEPVILTFTGAGNSTSSYPALERLVSPHARILLYDRSGLGNSERGTSPISAETAAKELSMALEAVKLGPPYILLAHSYGAIIVAREFLHLHDEHVVGMVLAEASTERQYLFFEIPDRNILSLLGDLSFATVTGLRDSSKLSREEWRARAEELSLSAVAAQEEADGYVPSLPDISREKPA
ncbi:hypothetical protein CISG_10231 [Coccidioides immitis RMSCC 3703]|uniref:AB hydrolase-1 domain-containing protein n=1 Tax=Coccidioides immitis RMSCC 3703 TaxID=454286 RepID=A0A0J8QN42_COCIT|nr:hypothetical protein CISG_10231 [Coccidioides immitis RMSCC 3703]